MQLFCDDHRQKIKEAHPDAAFGVITSKLAAAWKDATEEEKEKHRKQHRVSLLHQRQISQSLIHKRLSGGHALL